jgi:hypothetical protein
MKTENLGEGQTGYYTASTVTEPSPSTQAPATGPTRGRRISFYIAGIIAALILFSAIALILHGSNFGIITTVTTTQPTAPTTVSPSSNVQLNISTNSSMREQLLFGILNKSKYYLLLNSTIKNFTLGADNITSELATVRIYGLNFTSNLTDSPIEFPPGYNLSIPSSYSLYTLPISTSIFAYEEPNVAEAVKYYNYEREQVIFGNSKVTIPVHNMTVYYASNFSTSPISKPGYNYTTLDSEYPIPSGISGLNLTAISISPFYRNAEWYIIQAQYHNYFILFSYFGVLHHFNQSTALRIAQHYINTTIR